LGCYAQTEQYACELSARVVLPKLDGDLVEIKGASCCGFPLNSLSNLTWIYLTARNLAHCEDQHLDMLPLCNGCHLSMCEVKRTLEKHAEKLKEVDGYTLDGFDVTIALKGNALVFWRTP
jgi:heterodisulfide reductase subunit B